jgi:hypothetical protein
MTLVSDFKSDPKEFLKTHVIVCDEHAQMGAERRDTARFTLVAAAKNAVLLKIKLETGGEAIDAYWLPWLSKKATSMDLAADKDYFFTSELTNCRFTVLDPDPTKPKVAHVAGDLDTRKKRDTEEQAIGMPARVFKLSETPPVLARRLSVSESTGMKPKHDYAGQDGPVSGRSSAFVFGMRVSKNWEFYAQITKGTLTEGFFNTELTEDLTILNHAKRI